MKIRTSIGLAAAAVMALSVSNIGTADAAQQPAAAVANNTLTVAGTNKPDVVKLSLDDANTLRVNINDGTVDQTFDRTTFNGITVLLGNGDDQYVDATNGGADEQVTVDAGHGDDTMQGGSLADVFFAGQGDDSAQGGAGNDLFVGGPGDDFFDGDQGVDTALMGSGADTFKWDPGDGNDNVDGQAGRHDTLDFNGAAGSEIFSLSPNGSRTVFLRNLGNIRIDMDNVEQLDLDALGGSDDVTINDMSGTDFRHADIDVGVNGAPDLAAQTVTVKGTEQRDDVKVDARDGGIDVSGLRTETRITGSEPTLDTLKVNTLGGNDRVTVDPATSTQINTIVDLGLGQV